MNIHYLSLAGIIFPTRFIFKVFCNDRYQLPGQLCLACQGQLLLTLRPNHMQCIVLAIDAKRNGESWEVYTHGGRKQTGLDALEWAKHGVKMGAGEILLTSMDADGTLAGYNLELTRAIAEAVNVPVIASGGAGNVSHFADAVTLGGADAALAASLFHDKVLTIADVKGELLRRGIPVRIIEGGS